MTNVVAMVENNSQNLLVNQGIKSISAEIFNDKPVIF